ncbi:MAG: phosphoglycerate kinase, partial [Gemmatimonadales bacterium]
MRRHDPAHRLESVSKRTLGQLDAAQLDGQRVVVRVDLNVPMTDGVVRDDTRIRAALPTIKYLHDRGARVVLLSHLGRPKDGPDPRYSLKPLVRPLEQLLGFPVTFLADPTDERAVAQVRHLPRGGVALAENTRFYPGEESNDAALADRFALLG